VKQRTAIVLLLSALSMQGCASSPAPPLRSAGPAPQVQASCQRLAIAVLPVRFDLDGHTPVIEVMIDGYRVGMGIDTGSEKSWISPEAADRLDLPTSGKKHGRTIGVAGQSISDIYLVRSLVVAGQEFKDIRLTGATTLMSTVRHDRRDLDYAGMIGADLISHFDLDYDPANKKIAFYLPADCRASGPPWSGAFATLSVNRDGDDLLRFPVEIAGHRFEGFLDTGAGVSALKSSAAERVGLTPDILQKERSGTASGVGMGQKEYHAHLFSDVKIGGVAVREFHTVIGDFNLAADLSLGYSFLRTKRVFISYSTETLYLLAQPPSS